MLARAVRKLEAVKYKEIEEHDAIIYFVLSSWVLDRVAMLWFKLGGPARQQPPLYSILASVRRRSDQELGESLVPLLCVVDRPRDSK